METDKGHEKGNYQEEQQGRNVQLTEREKKRVK